MVKLRSAYYCNLKLLLIWLVIFGHWIEPQIWENPKIYGIYRWIYLVHIPLFSFLSGLFLRESRDCLRQLRRTLPLYLLTQGAAMAFGWGDWSTPWWHLWYLLSLSCWLLLAAFLLWLRHGRWPVLVLAIAAGCLCGRLSWLGRSWCPRQRFPWTRAGADTMPAYLIHGPVVWVLRSRMTSHAWLWTSLFLYIIHQAMRWHGPYGITGKEAKPWPDLKNSTKPTENRSTGSSCP